MVLNRSHIPWAVVITALSAIFAAFYLANFHPAMLPFTLRLPAVFGPVPPLRNTVGGTPLGLFFGTVALLIFFFASALGIRKKRRTWPLGNVQVWLKAHIWLTILTMPLVAFHCDFRAGGPMTTTLLIIYGIVMVSGYVGLALQQVMPRIMTQRLPREVVYEQIPYMRGVLLEKAELLWKELAPSARPVALAHAGGVAEAIDQEEEQSAQTVSEFLHDECMPYLRARRGDGHRLSGAKAAEDTFRLLRMHVTERWRPKIDLMYQWCDDRRLLDVQAGMHHWLHGWLIFHVPLSFTLLVLTVWHAFITLLYL